MNAIKVKGCDWGRIVLLSGLIVLLSGCNGLRNKQANPADYLAYISNPRNGLIQKKHIDNIMYEVRYISPEAMALAELRDINPQKQKLEKTIEEYGQMAYFRVNISAEEGHLFNTLRTMGENPDELESYLNFDAEHDFTLRTATDTVKSGLYHFNRSYGLSNSWQLMLAFDIPNCDRQRDLIVSYTDHISNSGQLNFRFSETDIANIPKLIY